MDLQGPLDDFFARMAQIRLATALVEAAAREPGKLTSKRAKVDLAAIGGTSLNTINAMSIVFLASSYEEFVREEIGECADYLSSRFSHLNIDAQIGIRASYWTVWLDKIRFARPISSGKKKATDKPQIAVAKKLLQSAGGFVLDGDALASDRSMYVAHSRNFRPQIVDELAKRLGLENFMSEVADNTHVKNHFGVNKKSEAAEKLVLKLDEFYDRRNEIVHSLSTAAGYATDVIFDYIEMFEATAEATRATLVRASSRW